MNKHEIEKLRKMDTLYLKIAIQVSSMSYAVRSKVGAIIVNNNNILSYGWNGTPAGDDNECEFMGDDGVLHTKHEVLHAESNALIKLVYSGRGEAGTTLYTTLSPCFDCAKLIKQAKVKRVVYLTDYRDLTGIDFLRQRNVEVFKFPEEQIFTVSILP